MADPKKSSIPPIYIVSGGKGIAGHTMVHSLIIQYPDNKIPVQVIPNVQSKERIAEVVSMIKRTGGVLTHTMVNSVLRHELIQKCKELGVTQIDMMGPLADYIENELGLTSVNVPGL
jgi:[pyruvate, water dikinase]-phosphate phosphotransferase / [pyruvate, water dikinase] kinase